ncbi:serine hydrolase domain-containing protein [Paenibacillus spongiae]|uniref:Beta-lactamase family protein n=1 Tax=Paenibacillus spongiae TaxID=2909671 RepID=A0ABY5SKH0_9BACL|nr:serine hydrolase domain-containing protein [Paenibacillus spongiae]UVI33093.1 beta-lactamase family protein [Paenibacillus spongiae]
MMNTNEQMIAHLEHILSEYVQFEAMPGLAVGIVKDNQVLYTQGFGVRNIQTGDPVDKNTLFHQASISKTAVGTGIMQLVERGMIDLDATVTTYLPYFIMADERFRLITVRQLLNHTSGMPDEDDYEWDRPQYDDLSLERYVRSISSRSLLRDPGEHFFYSNISYEILGDIIAKVTGMSFEQYMKKFIIEPSGMRSSTFFKHEADEHLATPHVLRVENGYGGGISEIFPYNRAHGPSSTLYANAEDMCRYAIVHLNRGFTPEGQTILSPQSYDEMWKPNDFTGHGDESSAIGLSWFIGEYKGFRIVSHSGMDTGFQSKLILLPDTGIAVAVMTNCDYVWLNSVYTAILDSLLGLYPPSIKRSLAHHLSKITTASGVDSALKAFNRLQDNGLERYYVWEDEFVCTANMLFDQGNREDAIRLLELTVLLFPESSTPHNRLQQLLTES